MSDLRKRVFEKWRDYFRGRRPTDLHVVDEMDEEPLDEIHEPADPNPRTTVLISHAGIEIPASAIDENSDKYLIKPESDTGGIVILMPWIFVGWIEYAEIITHTQNFALRDTTRGYDLVNSPAYPNGARVHLRSKYPGGEIGSGTLRVRCKDGAWMSWTGSFAKRSGDMILSHEGPAPLAESLLGYSNANAEEVNDLVYTDQTIQIPESWQIFQAILFEHPLQEGSEPIKRVRTGGGEECLLLFELPDSAAAHNLVLCQLQSHFAHVSYQVSFDPKTSFRGAPGEVVIYTPIGHWPAHTHDKADFAEVEPMRWQRADVE